MPHRAIARVNVAAMERNAARLRRPGPSGPAGAGGRAGAGDVPAGRPLCPPRGGAAVFLALERARSPPGAEALRAGSLGIGVRAANSAATLRAPASHFDLVRC